MQIRKVVTRSGTRMRGYFNSLKAQVMIPWESGLEKDSCLLFEFSAGIKTYRAYQEREIYYDGPIQKSCYIDFLLELHSGQSLLIEVKDERKLAEPAVRKKYALIAEHLQRQGRSFRLLTDAQINQEPRRSNLRKIAYHRPRMKVDWPMVTKSQLEKLGGKSLQEIGRLLGGERIAWQLLSTHQLHCDLSQAITSSTILSFVEADHDSLLF